MGYQNCAQQSADAVLNGFKTLLDPIRPSYIHHKSTASSGNNLLRYIDDVISPIMSNP